MGVKFILDFMRNPNMNFILFSKVIRSNPMLKLNEILSQGKILKTFYGGLHAKKLANAF